MTALLEQLATLVDGDVIGDSSVVCVGASPPRDVRRDQITMLDDSLRVELLDDRSPAAVVVPAAITGLQFAQLVVDDPHRAFAKIVSYFRPPVTEFVPVDGVDPSTNIAASAHISPRASIGAEVTIGERVRVLPGAVIMPRCRIGDDCVVGPNVTLYEYTQLGKRVMIHAGSVLGAHGFGYQQIAGRHVPTAQLGYVDVESDVEIGAGVTIDRGTYGATRIGAGTKIDNQVMIAHNCSIGRHNLLCSQVGIAGSCRTGDYVVLAGQVGLKDHTVVGDRAIVGAQSGVMNDLPGNQIYLGSPATTQREQMQIFAVQRRLPEIRRALKAVAQEIEQLQQRDTQSNRAA